MYICCIGIYKYILGAIIDVLTIYFLFVSSWILIHIIIVVMNVKHTLQILTMKLFHNVFLLLIFQL